MKQRPTFELKNGDRVSVGQDEKRARSHYRKRDFSLDPLVSRICHSSFLAIENYQRLFGLCVCVCARARAVFTWVCVRVRVSVRGRMCNVCIYVGVRMCVCTFGCRFQWEWKTGVGNCWQMPFHWQLPAICLRTG